MTPGEGLRQRLGSLSSGRLKLTALAVLLVYAIIMLWPYLAATLVRGSAVTAWMNLATAPIPGRAPVQLPLVGSHVGADGVIVELINEQLDPGLVPRAEAALAAAQAHDFRAPLKTSKRCQVAVDAVREVSPPITEDRVFATDFAKVAEVIAKGRLAAALK